MSFLDFVVWLNPGSMMCNLASGERWKCRVKEEGAPEEKAEHGGGNDEYVYTIHTYITHERRKISE